jgi:hypothetical protein
VTLPKKMIPAKLFTAVLNDACAFILATCEWVERKVDSALRGELTWSHFKRLTYWAVQRIQIVTITCAANSRSPGMGNHKLPAERWTSVRCLPSAPRFGASSISFQPLCFPVHAAARVLASRREGFLPSCFSMQWKPKLEIINILLTQGERFANYPLHRTRHNPWPLMPTLLIRYSAGT